MGDTRDISLHSLSLDHWIRRVRNLIAKLDHIYFKHMYMEYNVGVDKLSKKSIGNMDGCISFEEYRDGVIQNYGSLRCFGRF